MVGLLSRLYVINPVKQGLGFSKVGRREASAGSRVEAVRNVSIISFSNAEDRQ